MATKIVGGSFKNKKLATLDGDNTRPTSSFLRKVIFDMLGKQIWDASVLDLFAGIGALGLESISRGANHCTFLENHYKAFTVLEKNCSIPQVQGKTDLIRKDVFMFLKRNNIKFDGIFIDPPYDVVESLQNIDYAQLLKPNGWLVYQFSSKHNCTIKLDENKYNCREKKHGVSRITIYESKA